MRAKKLFFFANLLVSSVLYGQVDRIGWYHLLPDGETKLLENFVDQNKRTVSYASDEILLVFDFSGKKAFAIDVDGRIVEIQDTAKIKKITVDGRIVKIIKPISVSLTKKLNTSNNVWIIGFNSANNTAKVLFSSGEVAEIPKDSYVELTQHYINQNRRYPVHKVVDLQ